MEEKKEDTQKQQEPQQPSQTNLENQQTDDEDSIDEIEFEQQYPNLKHIVTIKQEDGQIIYEKQQNENIFKFNFKGHDLEITLLPPSKGQIKTYRDDWINVFDQKLGVYCDIKNLSQENNEQKLEMEVFDTPNNDPLVDKTHVAVGKLFKCQQETDNDYGTRDWEALHFYIDNKKYIVDTQILNPYHK